MANPCASPDFTQAPTEYDLKALPNLEERLRRKVGTCIADYQLIEDGDRILVGLSGGKDSWALLDALMHLQRRAPIHFQLQAITVDPGFSGYGLERIAEICAARGIAHTSLLAPIHALVERQPHTTPCAICSRLRRGVIYSYAKQEGFSKIALGHHLDDLIETLLLNQFFEGRLSTMPIKLLSDDRANTVIRPLAYLEEEDLQRYAWLKGYPIVPCGCPFDQANPQDSRRAQIKTLIAQLRRDAPDLKFCMLNAMKNVKTSHLLDKNLLGLPEAYRR